MTAFIAVAGAVIVWGLMALAIYSGWKQIQEERNERGDD